MGQEQMVEVYRLITKGTIEEKIQELQEQKKHLVSQVLDGTESRAVSVWQKFVKFWEFLKPALEKSRQYAIMKC